MELQEFPSIENQIKSLKTAEIELLNLFIFGSEQNRQNRANLRAYKGFPFKENSPEFADKPKKVTDIYDNIQITTDTNILSTYIHGSTEEIATRILSALSYLRNCF